MGLVLLELAGQLQARGLELCAERAPRGKNEEADALANMEFG